MRVTAERIKRAIAVAELLLIAPAALFMGAVFVRNLQPEAREPAHSAQQIVAWCAERRWTLGVFLICLPLLVLASGSATLLSNWKEDADLRRATLQTLAAVWANLPLLLIAAATLTAAGTLAIVPLHVLSD